MATTKTNKNGKQSVRFGPGEEHPIGMIEEPRGDLGTPGDPSPAVACTLGATMVALRREVPRIFRKRVADTGKYKYKYASLEDIYHAIDPVCERYGVRYSHPIKIENGQQWVGTRVELLATGEYEDYWILCPGNLQPQDMGKAITYFRRYSLECAFAIIATKDDDYSPARRQEPRAQEPAPRQASTPAHANGNQPPKHQVAFREWLKEQAKLAGLSMTSAVNLLFQDAHESGEEIPDPSTMVDVSERCNVLGNKWVHPSWKTWMAERLQAEGAHA